MSTRTIDPFKSEKEAQLRVQAERAREAKIAMDAQISAARQREIAKEREDERERIQKILTVKMAELNVVETRRAKDMEQAARGVRLNFDRVDAFIESTNVEIKQLQDELYLVEKIDDTI